MFVYYAGTRRSWAHDDCIPVAEYIAGGEIAGIKLVRARKIKQYCYRYAFKIIFIQRVLTSFY